MFKLIFLFCGILVFVDGSPEYTEPFLKTEKAIPSYFADIRDGIEHIGVGILFKDRTIVTSASYLAFVKNKEDLTIQVGPTSNITYGASKFIIHPKFNFVTKNNDIAIIRLNSDLKAETDIRFPKTEIKNGTKVSIIKIWGVEEGKIISNSECAGNKYSYGDRIKKSMICASNFHDSEDHCNTYQRSTLMIDNMLVGIGSWFFGCDNIKTPGIYTSIFEKKLWILGKANEL